MSDPKPAAAPAADTSRPKGVGFMKWVVRFVIVFAVLFTVLVFAHACTNASVQKSENDKKVAAAALTKAGVASPSTAALAAGGPVSPEAPTAVVERAVVKNPIAGVTCVLCIANGGTGSPSAGSNSSDVPEEMRTESTPPPMAAADVFPYTATAHDTDGGDLIHGRPGYGIHIVSPAWPHPQIETVCMDFNTEASVTTSNANQTNECSTWRYRSVSTDPVQITYVWRKYH